MPTSVPMMVVSVDHDQRDGQRDARADDAAREDVAAELVGAEEVDGACHRSTPKKWMLAGMSQNSW